MRVTFLTHYYAPEIGAPQTRLGATTQLLREYGHDIRVVTGVPHYPTGVVTEGYRADVIRRERRDGIEIIRLPVIARPNRGFRDRVIDQGSFAFAACASADIAARSDVVVVESPPLFLGLTARFLAMATGTPYLFHVADPWPDFPIAVGALRGRIPVGMARWIEARAYAGASLITTVSPPLVERLDRNPNACGKVRLLENGVDVHRFAPEADPRETDLPNGWTRSAFTLAYVGTVGLAQGVATLVDAAAELAAEGVDVHIVGEGADRPALEAQLRVRKISNVHIHAPVAADQVPGLLAAADALVVLLKAGPLYDESLPTKLVEGLAAGRPIILSGSGFAAQLVRESGAGFVAAPEDVGALRRAILDCLVADREAMGQAARSLATTRFDRRLIVERLNDYLLEVAASRRPRRAADGRVPW